MKNTPLKISAYDLAARFAVLQNADRQLNYVVNLISYRSHGIVSSGTLRHFAQMVVIDEAAIYKRIDSYRDINELIDFCIIVNNMYKIGFISITNLRFMRVAVDRRFRDVTSSRRGYEDIAGIFKETLIYN